MRKYILVTILLVLLSGIECSYGQDGGQWLVYQAVNPNQLEDGYIVKDYQPPTTTTTAATKVTIPNTYNGYPVVQIGFPAFKDNVDIEHVVIPDSVEAIYGGFKNCTALKRIDVPESVTAIGMWSFEGCENLQEVGLGRVSQLETGIFEECKSLIDIEIPTTVTHINSGVFKNCISLESILIPSGVTDLTASAFEGCTGLEQIQVNGGHDYASDAGVLFNKNKSRLIKYPANKSGERYMIPESVESVDWYAFEDNPHLNWISITKNVEKISEEFNHIGPFLLGCENVSEIVVDADNLYFTAENGTLYNKDKTVLRRYPEARSAEIHTVYGGVETIERSAFRQVKHLKHLVLQGPLKEVEKDAFLNCTGLLSMTLPTSEIIFGEEALAGVTSELIIKGTTGGFAEEFAQNRGYTFEDLSGLPTNTPEIENLKVGTLTSTSAAVQFTVTKAADYSVIALHPSESYSPFIWHPNVTPKVRGHVEAKEIVTATLSAYKGDIHFEPGSPYRVYVSATDADNNFIYKVIDIHTLYPKPQAPSGPLLQSKTYDEIRLKVVAGMEYSINNGVTWQTSHVFKNLGENTSYTFIQRIAAHDYYPASYESTVLRVKTPERYPNNDHSTHNSSGSSNSGSSKKDKNEKSNFEKSENQKIEIIKSGEKQANIKLKEKIKESARIEIPDAFIGNDIVTTVDTGDLKVKLNGKMFKNKSDHVDLEIKKVDKKELNLSNEIKEQIGDNPVFDISLIVNEDKVDWSSETPIEIEIALDNHGKPAYKFVAVYIDKEGQPHILKNSFYNGDQLIFDTTHLSHYSVMYIDKTFSDVQNHWSKEAVEALAIREFIRGKPEGNYDPDALITRAELVSLAVIFFDLKGQTDIDTYFDDVLSTDWYAENLSTALASRIVPYDTDDFLALEAATREELMYIIHHGVTQSNKPISDGQISLDGFVDKSLISPDMFESVQYCVSKDLIQGDNSMIRPTQRLSRGEVAQAFYNLLKKSY